MLDFDKCSRAWLGATSAVGRLPAPVPRLVDDAVRVIARVAQLEAVFTGMGLQPGECVGRFERFLGWELVNIIIPAPMRPAMLVFKKEQ